MVPYLSGNPVKTVKSNESEVVLLCNPAAGGHWRELAGILDSAEARFARRVVTDSIEDVGPALVALSRRTKLLCVYGGDGTIQRVLDALYLSAETFEEPPQLAFIGGGTMNVGARWCGLNRSPGRNFRDVIRSFRRGTLSMRDVPLLRVSDGGHIHYGFTFGLGPLVRVLDRYERGRKGKLAAIRAGLTAAVAGLGAWPSEWQPTVSELSGSVTIDGERLPFERYAAVFCSVTGLVNPTVEPFALTRTPETFYCLAYAVSRREFILAIPLLWRGYAPVDARKLLDPISTWKQIVLSYFGKGLLPSDPRYVNVTARRLRVDSEEPIYTVDGEILRSTGAPVEVTLGPQVRLAVSPTADLGPVLKLAADIVGAAPMRTKPE
jgi:diacylglycerol kinase family enzyme